jgi:hypothetical protein
MLWDTTDTTATFGGTASGKVENPVSYEENGTILVISVTDDFIDGDTLTISGLSFTSFTAVNTAVSALGLRTTGSGTTTSANDNRTIAIYGTLTLDTHGDGQVTDNFNTETETGIPLHAFRLVPAGEYMDVTALSFALTGVNGITTDDLTNVRLYRDTNSDGIYDGGDIQVGGDGVDTITDQTGTIVFSTTFTASTTSDYILIGDLVNLENRDAFIVSLDTAYLTIVGTTTGNGFTSGSPLSIQHMRGGGGGGSISLVIGGAPPAGDGIRTGGTEGAVDPNTGDTIGSEVGFNAPGDFSSVIIPNWTTPASVYNSDGVYATAFIPTSYVEYNSFNFSVPSNNIITGIEVKLEASANTAAGDISVKLTGDGGSSVTSAKTTNTLTTSDAVYVLGSPSDTWGACGHLLKPIMETSSLRL